MTTMQTKDGASDTTTEVFSTVMANIGAHGIPNIRRAANTQRRLAWACLFFGGLFMFGWQGFMLGKHYLQYDVAVNVGLGFEASAIFPAVTVCNLNSVRWSALDGDTAKLKNLLRHYVTEDVYQDWEELDFTEQPPSVGIAQQSLDILSNLTYGNRTQYGHLLSTMMLSCTFNGYPCAPSNFTHFYNYLHGNCYTFNFDSEDPKMTSISGKEYGLTMHFDIEQYDYTPELQDAAGMKVYIADQNQMPFPEDHGVIVSPGFETSISLNKVVIDRLGHPYTTCKNEKATVFSDFYTDVNYSLSACEKSCVFEAILDACGCADRRYRFTEMYSPCFSTNATQSECVEHILCDGAIGLLNCRNGCMLPCREIVFEETVSSAKWPSLSYEDIVTSALEEAREQYEQEMDDDPNFISNNLVKVNVYLSSRQYQHIFQVPDYGLPELVSDLGGQVGLWMGFSILTLCEILELLFDLLKIICARSKSKRKVSTKVKDIKDPGWSISSRVDTMTIVD